MKAFVLALLGLAVAGTDATAQETVPSSTNPAERVVYRGDKTGEQQMSAQLACYTWAGQQPNWDPEQAYAQLKRNHGQALQQYQAAQGGAARGAARGALAGLAIGAIAGDAGKGAAIGAVAGAAGGGGRARRGRQAAQAAFEQAMAEFSATMQLWARHWTACMIGSGYGVG